MTQGLQTGKDNAQKLSLNALTSLRFLRHRLNKAAAEDASIEAFLDRAAPLLTSAINPDAIAWATLGGDQLQMRGLTLPIEGLPDTLRRDIASRAVESTRSGVTHVSMLGAKQQMNCICAPVAAHKLVGILIVLHSGGKAALPLAMSAAELVASAVTAAEFRFETQRVSNDALEAGALIDLLARVEALGSLQSATKMLCAELRQFTDCTDVFFGLFDSDDEIIRYSTRATGDSSVSEETRLGLNAAMHEALMHGQPAMFPPPQDGTRHALLAHRMLAQNLAADRLVSCALHTDDGHPWGALILSGQDDQLSSPRLLRFLEASEPRIASTICLLSRAERKGAEKLISSGRSILRGKRTKAILSLVAGIALLLCIPLPYNVKAACELHPLNHRYVAAPFDAPLDQCVVEPGDMVDKDQLLAVLDGREVRLGLSEVASDLNRAAREQDMHRAKGEYGAAEVARLQMQAHESRKEMLEYRSEHLEIRSPCDGVVVSGDWKKSVGVPMKIGENMFEISPLGHMIVEVGIPEDDITHVAIGQEVTVQLEAYAGDRWTGKLIRVHPAAEVRENEHVFIGEVEIDNPELRLRPGMRGHAKIETAAHPILWNVFHKPWNKAIAWLRHTI